jgi:hypothetical protein
MCQFLSGKQVGASGGQAYSVRQRGCKGRVFVLFHLPFHYHKLLYSGLLPAYCMKILPAKNKK